MRRKLTWVMLLCTVIVVTALYTGNAVATPAVGFVGTTLALGGFGGIDLFNQLIPHDSSSNVWLSFQKTIGLSDVYVQSNVWDPGGDTGWHTHPGSSLIIRHSGNGDGL